MLAIASPAFLRLLSGNQFQTEGLGQEVNRIDRHSTLAMHEAAQGRLIDAGLLSQGVPSSIGRFDGPP
jgi:hypothetical protein